MLKYLLLILSLASPAATLAAGTTPPDYNAAAIPKNLQPYANAIVRNQESVTEVKALDQVIFKYKEAITILNGNGAEYGNIAIYYDKSRQLKNLKGAIYDGAGKLIKKIAASDFQDASAISAISLFEDDRVKHFSPAISSYPYTVEHEYEIRYKQSFFFPDWVPQKNLDLAVENSSYRFICRPDFKTRLKQYNVGTPPKETLTTDTRMLEWQAQNLPALKSEPFSPPATQYMTLVEIAPVMFSYEGLTGQFTNWQEYGKWAYENLVKGRDQLPPATVAHIKQLVQQSPSAEDKIKKVYEYAQQKNRYISVQIGIGGLQPMKAEEVDRLSYGDCKALTNYTRALLQAADIKSFYAEVNSGQHKRSYLPDFASAGQGNHVILCVPLPQAQDTIWLECTSREAPMGYLGTFTDDRKVLLYTENGGVIARTKRYAPEQNRQIRSAIFTLDDKGSLQGKMETRFEGTQYDNRDQLLTQNNKDRMEQLKQIYTLNNLEVTKYELSGEKNTNPSITEKVELSAVGFGLLNNNLLQAPLFQLTQGLGVPKEVRNRKQKVVLTRGFYDEDQLTYNLPANYRVEYIPEPVVLENEFGSYTASVKIAANQLFYTRKLLLKEGEFAPDSYEKLHTFLKKIAAADQQKFVLVKN